MSGKLWNIYFPRYPFLGGQNETHHPLLKILPATNTQRRKELMSVVKCKKKHAKYKRQGF